MNNDRSELLESIRLAIMAGEMSARDVASSVGMSKQAFNEFIHNCRGTQIARVEQILDALGYEIVLRRKERKK